MLFGADNHLREVKSRRLYNQGAACFNEGRRGLAYWYFCRAARHGIDRAINVGNFYRAAALELPGAAMPADPQATRQRTHQQKRLHQLALDFYARGVGTFPDVALLRAMHDECTILASMSHGPAAQRYEHDATYYAGRAAHYASLQL